MAAESLPEPVQQANPKFRAKSFRIMADYTRGRGARRWAPLFLWEVICMLIALVATGFVERGSDPNPRWGGFNSRPMDEQCYKQERIATLLAFFLGCLGVDQFYARHWLLAVFKLLSFGGFGLWWLVDLVLWIIGGQYSTPGCPGGAPSGHEWLY